MSKTMFEEGDRIRDKRADAWSSLATYRIMGVENDSYKLENTYDRPLVIPKWYIEKNYTIAKKAKA